MFKSIAKALGGDPLNKEMQRMGSIVEHINQLEAFYETLSENDLRAKTYEFKQRLSRGESLDDLLPEAFAAVREASKRSIGLRHFDIQLIGGVVLHEGRIAEMRTGEGKTLVATLPLYLNALSGRGVHLVTVNDYLARRDARWMGPIYHLLGMSVGVLQMSSRAGDASSAYLVDLNKRDSREEEHQLIPVPRAQAYAADITYGTNQEFGFDYLRDNLVMDIKNRVQRGFHYAIIDEVDNILIDEARTPLIISGPASEDVEWYTRMAAVVRQLNPEDYDLDEKERTIALTEIGEAHVEDLLKMPLRDPDRPEDITPDQARLLGYLEQALRAQFLFHKNKDYIVQNGEVVIVDEFTGRLMPGRRWSEGLHQAIEAKEGVKVKPENVTHATITLQNYFRKYEKLAGMTGTAATEAEEFSTIYSLDVIEIPTNLDFEAQKPNSELLTLQARDEEGYTYIYYTRRNDPQKLPLFWKRKDYPDVVYRTIEGKLRAIVLEILKLHVIGRPQLVGTTSIEHSEQLSARLRADPLRRLCMVTLIRQAYYKKNNISVPERTIPELEFLNKPLQQLSIDEMRKFAASLGMASIDPEAEENLRTLGEFLGFKESQSERLKNAILGGIPHQVLNALKHDQESQIIAGAGAFGAVTIATNMAGRGVDIKLGGEIREEILSDVRKALNSAGINPYGMTNAEMEKALDKVPQSMREPYQEPIDIFQIFMDEMKRVRQLGGLHIIGSERHEARRIDNQLRGRSARQGDPGSSRFYLSLEDDLMRMFGGDRAQSMMQLFNIDPSVPLESRMLGRMVEQAQERVEGYNFDIRKHLLEYDDVLNDQRERIYQERDRVLTKEDLEEDVLEMLRSEINRRVPEALADAEGPWKLLAFLEEIQPTIFYPAQNERIISFSLAVILKLMQKEAGDALEPARLKSVALSIAARALEAEKSHLIAQTQAFIQRSANTFDVQLSERKELLDIFIDNLEEYEGMSNRELSTLLQNQLQLKINLPAEIVHGLLNKSEQAQQAINNEVEKQLMSIFLSRILLTIERRLGARLGLDLNTLKEKDWLSIENAFLNSINSHYAERINTLDSPSSQILYNIEAVLKRQVDNGVYDLAELAALMPQGTQTVIDMRTRQRVSRRVSLLNYVFLAAHALEGKSPDQITGEVLFHLQDAQQHLQIIWGKMELQRIAYSEDPQGFLRHALQENHSNDLSPEELETLVSQDPQEILSQNNEKAIRLLGRHVQNLIYRHILLRTISDLWIEHLTQMEALRVSIRMEAYAQQDPLVQYKNQSTDRFRDLLSNIRLGVISQMFRLQPSQPRQPEPQSPPVAVQASTAQKSDSAKRKRKRHKKR